MTRRLFQDDGDTTGHGVTHIVKIFGDQIGALLRICDDSGDSIIGDVTETPILEECCRSSVVGSAVLLSMHQL